MLRCDIVKDDSGPNAVFKEQGSSASQMRTAKVMEVIARLPGCAGQAAYAVSASTKGKTEDIPGLLKLPKSECLDRWIRLPRYKWPKPLSNIEESVALHERNLCGLVGFMWERKFEKVLLGRGWEKGSELGMLVRASKARSILIRKRG